MFLQRSSKSRKGSASARTQPTDAKSGRGNQGAPKLSLKSRKNKLLPKKHPLHLHLTKMTRLGVELYPRPPYLEKKFESKGWKLVDERRKMLRDADQQEAYNDAASTFLNPDKVYMMMLKGFSTITTNGSGIVNVELPFDPSSSGYNFAEWTDLSGLFSQVKLMSVHLSVTPANWSQAASPSEIATIAGCINPTASATPGSYGTVISNADGKMINGQCTSTVDFKLDYSGNSWSPTSTVVVTPYAGCPGGFLLYGSNYPNTTQVAYVVVKNVYAFRGRA